MIDFKPNRQSNSLAPWISFLVSFSVHTAMCIALAVYMVGIGHNGSSTIQLSFAEESGDDSKELATFEVMAPLPDEPVLEQVANESLDINNPSEVDVSLALDSKLVATQFNGQDAVKQAAAMGGSIADILDGGKQKSKSKATFFGAEAYGNRFVFVIDSSGSMRGPRWEALCYELERALQSLSPDQEFFIVSFDTEPHPMFGVAPPAGDFLHPEKKNIQRVRSWLRSLHLGSNTYPSSSLGIALRLKPDAIFLLSDGEIMDNTVFELRHWNRKMEDGEYKPAIPVHTVLLHSPVGYATLETIANDNDGTFTPVPMR